MYVLLFKSVTPEDVGEIKFTAEKASSSAKLKVKGKTVECSVVDVCPQLKLKGWRLIYRQGANVLPWKKRNHGDLKIRTY